MLIEFNIKDDPFLAHNEVIPSAVDKVEIVFRMNTYAVGDLVLAIKDATHEQKSVVYLDEPVDLTEFFKIPGEVNASLSLLVRGEVARSWQLESFCVKETPSGITAIPLIEDLKARVTTLEAALCEVLTLIKD